MFTELLGKIPNNPVRYIIIIPIFSNEETEASFLAEVTQLVNSRDGIRFQNCLTTERMPISLLHAAVCGLGSISS